MEDFEIKAIEKSTQKPACWYRYVDDTFVIWPHGQDTSDWSNLINQRLPNTVLIMITSSDYKTLNSCQQKPATWIVSSEKPSKLRCIQITSTEMGDSISANPGSLCCIPQDKLTATQYNTVIPPAQHLFIPSPSSTTCCAYTRPVRSLYFLLALPQPFRVQIIHTHLNPSHSSFTCL